MDRDWMNTFGYLSYQQEKSLGGRQEHEQAETEPVDGGISWQLLAGLSSVFMISIWAMFLIN